MPKISQQKWNKVKEKLRDISVDVRLEPHEKKYWDWLIEQLIERFLWYLDKNR